MPEPHLQGWGSASPMSHPASYHGSVTQLSTDIGTVIRHNLLRGHYMMKELAPKDFMHAWGQRPLDLTGRIRNMAEFQLGASGTAGAPYYVGVERGP